MADALGHYLEAQRLLEAQPANEDEQEEWHRVRGENIAAADVHATLAQVALEAESRLWIDTNAVAEREARWREAFRGS